MEKKDISYKLQITEEEKIVAEQLVTRADYLPRVGETITVLPYEGPLDDFVEKIRIKEEVDKHIPWIKGSYALLRFQQEFAGDYQVIRVQYNLTLFGSCGITLQSRLSRIEREEKEMKEEIEEERKRRRAVQPDSRLTMRRGLECFSDQTVKLWSVDIPSVVVTKLKVKTE